jgi:hypothetical protein
VIELRREHVVALLGRRERLAHELEKSRSFGVEHAPSLA